MKQLFLSSFNMMLGYYLCWFVSLTAFFLGKERVRIRIVADIYKLRYSVQFCGSDLSILDIEYDFVFSYLKASYSFQ